MTRTFTVYGKIRGQGRPRAVSKGKFATVYKPKEDRLYESKIVAAYIEDLHNPEPFGEVPLELLVWAYYEVPKSFSGAKRDKALCQDPTFPTKKPDADNVLKSIFDSLSGVAYPDDKFIVDAHIIQRYSTQERLVVSIKEMK